MSKSENGDTKSGEAVCSDLRSPLAKARDEFMNSGKGSKLTNGTTSGQYLRNRVEAAWLDGVEWGRKNPNVESEGSLGTCKGEK